MTTYSEHINKPYFQQLNTMFFNIENEAYKPQKMVMKLYHYFKHFGMTLKEAWAHVRNYFEPVVTEHTCREALDLSKYYGKGTYNGD